MGVYNNCCVGTFLWFYKYQLMGSQEHCNDTADRMYVVIKFLDDGSVSEVPKSWLIQECRGQTQYQWPLHANNVTNLIAKYAAPTPGWPTFNVEVLKEKCSSQKSARNAASDSEYETTDNENLGRGKRKVVSIISESTDEETILPPKIIRKNTAGKAQVAIDGPGDELANFEQAMLLTGYGRYNIILLLVCGMIMTSFGCQYGLSAYIIPSAKCDLKLSSGEMGWFNAAFLIGTATGAIGSGAIADAIGRRKILIWSLFIDGCVTLLSSLTQNFPVLFASRCISGLVMGGPATIILTFFGEFHAEKSRATAICYLGLFWAFSTMLLPAMAWIIIPLEFDIVVYGFVFNSWRLFLGIFGLPSLLGAFLISKYPETPKFLLSRGQNINALKVMREMFVSNTQQEAHYYPVKTLTSEYSTTHNECNTFSNTSNNMCEQVRYLFSPLLGKYTILSGFILFANMWGYYGLGLWLPELFNRLELYHRSHPNGTITVCELVYHRQDDYEITAANASEHSYETSIFTKDSSIWSNTTAVQLLADNTPEICDSSVNAKVFLNTIIIGFCCLLGNTVTGYLANRWGRRVMPIATMLIAGICGCMIYFSRTSIQTLIVTCLFSSFISMANMVIYSVIIDVFPTNVSAMATGVSSVLGRLGGILSNILFGSLLDISCEVPIFLVGGVVIFGGFLGFLLPKYPLKLP